ncbi:glycerol-3-phosphate acyltransferase PlsY [Kineothrix alysoides]|uniref:Glycerol-3-phosphate acyltransferase n=1 Tax=Kineothrix alysoides TaxID=1469948 RepID=A0A4R1QPN1_9FIRM|nr:glycerol-3-phosphate 1-O-acyltransferase PlsY [Kineothrix alysoides]TCL55698.1 glycerol-3-phosphate acyltransferase PlsY [Kineothrix alysoides]
MERIVCLVIGYLFGLFQTAYIYGKMKGIDIRKHGSGNAGTTNTLRVLGTKAGLIVFAGDVIKCIFAVVICTLLFGKSHPDMVYLLKMYAAAGAILGHNFPFYLNFKGGKGIAATAGLILSFHPTFLPVGVIMFFGAFLLTHYVSLGSLLVYAAFIIQIVVSGQLGLFEGMTQAELIEMYVIALFLTIMAYYKHWENIKRLIKGEERKTYLFKK